MPPLPGLTTARLSLRPFAPEDAPDVRRLAGAREVAATTLSIPHPYPEGAAEQWIARQAPAWAEGLEASFAILERAPRVLVGGIGLRIAAEHQRAEMGYWIGVPYWNRGFCTEAAREVMRWAFGELGLHRIHACHFAGNPASGRVLEKIGMRREGTRRDHVRKWGRFLDLEEYAILVEDWRATEGKGS